MYRFFRKIWRHIAARLRRRTPRKPSNCRQHNLALRNYAPAPKYNAEFPECSRFRTHTHTHTSPSGYPSPDWVHIERLARGVIRLPELTLQLVGRVQELREAIVAKIEEN